MPKCNECKHFERPPVESSEDKVEIGICHRYPQALAVRFYYWCGEFVALPVTQQEPKKGKKFSD